MFVPLGSVCNTRLNRPELYLLGALNDKKSAAPGKLKKTWINELKIGEPESRGSENRKTIYAQR